MHTFFRRAIAALPLVVCATPVLAGENAASDPVQAENEILAIGHRVDAHGPAGTMGDHVHRAGEVMIGASYVHEDYGGANRRGRHSIDDITIANAGYAVKVADMTMDMVMLHLMWAPSDRVTLMAMPMWMRMDMTMEGLPMVPANMGSSHAGHTLAPGRRMSHGVEGIGDTQIGALIALSRKRSLSVHAGMMLSAPTGKVDRKSANGAYMHYMMQGGSGTWDLNPSVTLRGESERIGWGAQASYLFRAAKANDSGFRFGDRFALTGWLSKPVSDAVSLSARAQFSDEGRIHGHYNGPHSHASPPDRQANYGGQRLDAGLGVNIRLPGQLRFGVEANVPVWQKVNGIQLPRRWSTSANVSRTF